MRVRNTYHLALPALAVASAAQAEPASLLDEIVVTGTRTERKLLDVPVRTEVISDEEVQSTHARDLAEALRSQPGLLLRDITGKTGTEVWLQGLDADRVLVLIDGRPVSASTGSSTDLSQIAVGDVDHIEIVKGAVSALHGSSAMGGVVNIITRRSEAPIAYSATVDAGTYGDKNRDVSSHLPARHLSANVSGKRGPLSARLSGDARDTEGFDLDKRTYRYEGADGLKYNLSGAVAWHYAKDSEVSLQPALYQENVANGFSDIAPGIGEIRKQKYEKAKRVTTQVGWKHALGARGKLSGYVMRETFDDHTEQDVLATPIVDQARDASSSFDKAELLWDAPLGERQLWTIGVVGFRSELDQHQVRRESGRELISTEVRDAAHRSTEYFVQNDWFVGEHWELLPGVRWQEDSDFGRYFAPKLSAMYRAEWWPGVATRLRAGIGRGYRVPNLKERFFVFDHSQLGYMILGNPKLEPEQSNSYQAGIEVSNREGLRAELSVFHNDIEDLIDTDVDQAASVSAGLQVFKYVNVSRARTRGADLVVAQRFGAGVSGDLGYTYLDTLDRDTGKALTNRPRHQVKAGLDWRVPAWATQVSLRATYQGDEFINSANTIVSPAWTRFDLKFNQPVAKGVKVFLGIDNLTDEHRDPLRAGEDFRPKEGRFIYAGVRLEG